MLLAFWTLLVLEYKSILTSVGNGVITPKSLESLIQVDLHNSTSDFTIPNIYSGKFRARHSEVTAGLFVSSLSIDANPNSLTYDGVYGSKKRLE